MSETLEQAAENFFNDTKFRNYKTFFCEGAKWQAERSYTEEEVFMILESYRNWDGTNFHQGEWFEQFKKK